MNPMQYVAVLGSSMIATYVFASLSPDDPFTSSTNRLPSNVDNLTTEQLCHWYSMDRKWKHPFGFKNNSDSEKNTITFMSYNILADGFYINSHKKTCDEKYLQWDYRWKLIKSQILAYKPDIIAMQEPTMKMYKKFLKNTMQDTFNMKGYHAPKFYSRHGDEKQSDALFINQDKFDIIGAKIIQFNDILATIENLNDYTKKSQKQTIKPAIFENISANNGDQSCYKTGFWQLMKYRKDSAIIALIKRKNDSMDKCFAICASHLYFDPKFPDIKAGQAYLLNNAVYIEIDKMLSNMQRKGLIESNLNVEDIPIALGIDANALPFVDATDPQFSPWVCHIYIAN